MKISTKLMAGYLAITLMVVLACGAGYRSIDRLSDLLLFITGDAWDSADGAMEATIGVEAHMLAVERLLDGEVTVEMLDQHQQFSQQALSRLVRAGVLESNELKALGDQYQTFVGHSDEMLAQYIEAMAAKEQWQVQRHQVLQLLDEVQRLTVGEMQALADKPGSRITWRNNVAGRWQPARTAFELQLLVQENITANPLADEEQTAAFRAVLDTMAAKAGQLESVPALNRPIGEGNFQGEAYSIALVQAIAEYRSLLEQHYAEDWQLQEQVRSYDRQGDQLLALLDVVEEKADDTVESQVAVVDASSATAYWVMTLVLLAGIATAVVVVVLVVNVMIRWINNTQQALDQLSDGRLDVRFENSSGAGNDLAAMNRALGRVVDNFSTAMNKISEYSATVNEVSSQIAEAAQDINRGANDQAASVEETSVSIEQMNATVDQNSKNARSTEDMANNATEVARSGAKAVSETVMAMRQIAEKISIIDDIAYQTNLLALNASIEASRAGEDGRGFSVVATEVRKLAERSKQAASDVSALAEHSVSVAESAGELFGEILPGITRTAELVQEIAIASGEQSSGLGEITIAMQQLDRVARQNASASEQLSAMSRDMQRLVDELNESVAFFQTGS